MRAAHDAIYVKDKRKEEVAATKVELAIGGVARCSRTIGTTTTEGVGGALRIHLPRRAHLFFFQEPELGHILSFGQWLKERKRKKQTGF